MRTTEAMEIRERMRDIEQGYVLEYQGLTLTRELTKVEWVQLGKLLILRRESSTWALGDWLVEGGREDRRWYHFSTYARAMEITGYDKSTLVRAFRTASAFAKNRREPNLSFSCHSVALRLPLDERQVVLHMAAHDQKKRWSADDLTEYINELERKAHPADPPKPRRSTRSYYASPQVRCPNCKHEFPIKGNKVARA